LLVLTSTMTIASAQRRRTDAPVSTTTPPRAGSGFQEPTAERTVSAGASEEEPTARARRPESDDEGTESLEDTLYLRERPDALGEAAHEWQDEEIERLLHER